MKRIALLILIGFSFFACSNPTDPDPITEQPTGDQKVSLRIHVPPSSLSTYASEDASTAENGLDSIFVAIYQGVFPGTLLETRKFELGVDAELTRSLDSVYNIAYEVDNISNPPLRVEVFANNRQPSTLPANTEIALPSTGNFFFMSGTGNLTHNGTSYVGEIHIERNVAKLRVNVSLNNPYMPTDLEIDYDNIEIEVRNTRSSTTVYGDIIDNTSGYTSYPARTKLPPPITATTLRPKSTFNTTNGGQLDSLYLFENINANSGYNPITSSPVAGGSATNATVIRVTIPTKSVSEGNKSSYYDYPIFTPGATNYAIVRNHIYTLDIKVRGQSLDPLITLDILPWNDVQLDGNIYGTFLTVDKSDISFDPLTGEVEVNYCTDAQAIYFNFAKFNAANPSAKIRGNIQTEGMDTSRIQFPLAPDGFQDAQILIDQFNTPYCGTFKFKLDPNDFPGFPNINFSGSICMKAGNIVKCFTFPGRNLYDAHFIVGDPLLGGISFSSATVIQDGGNSPAWLQVSKDPLYNANATQNFTTGTDPLFLHLDENLTGRTRTGSVILNSGGVAMTVYISQLPAIRVGRFGHTSLTNPDSIYDAVLYMEQLYEFTTRPVYFNNSNTSSTSLTPINSVYNGRRTAISVFDWAQYNNSPYLNYQNTLYQAINYCAQKNRISSGTVSNDLKWYLPSQAQLMGMWITNNLDTTLNSNFERMVSGTMTPADLYWSSTWNYLYTAPRETQYMNFNFGNVGHRIGVEQNWARCVRDGGATVELIPSSGQRTVIEFRDVMPSGSWSTDRKDGTTIENELGGRNKTLPDRLRVAISDATPSGVVWNFNACSGYGEGDAADGKWRLPTQRELQAIWILQSEMDQETPFKLLENDYYWTQTQSSSYSNNAWVVFGSRTIAGDSGNTPHRLKTEKSRVRCVVKISDV